MVGLRQIFLTSFCFMILAAVLLSTTSNMVELKYPELAMRLNPFNNNALIQIITNDLEAGDAGNLSDAEQLAIRGTYLSRGDARIFSMLGVVSERQGKIDKAQMLFEHALAILPTEGYALLNRFGYLIRNERPSDAVELADIIYRRWRDDLWPLLDSYWPYILSDRQAFQKAVHLFGNSGSGKQYLVASLFSGLKDKPENIKFAQALIVEWIAQKSGNMQILINQLVVSSILLKKPDQAYGQFVSLLDEKQKAELGYVFNSTFTLQPSGNFFDWTIQRQQGLDVKVIGAPETGAGIGAGALDISFRNSPVETKLLWQNLKLPSGKFELSSSHMTRDLRVPKIVRIYIGCGKGNKPMVELPLSDTGGKSKRQKIRFEVPNKDCETQRLWLGTEFFAKSWKNRFSGTLRLFEISVDRPERKDKSVQ